MLTRKEIYGYLDHWKRALMGPVVTIILLVYQQATSKPLTLGWFAAIVAAGLAWHFRSEYENEKSKALLLDYPKPFLQFIRERNFHSDRSEFFVQVESDKNAFDVEMTSEPVVGINHKRLIMEWAIPKGSVGKIPVPVAAFCKQYDGKEVPHLAGGISLPGQIDTFFERKKDFHNELEVTMKFKDVDGRGCPPKKFKITSSRDYRGNFEIGCIPFENQAASRT
jgi:hypothetical protein